MERKLLSLPIFKQNFSILFECIIFLREKCVGVRLLSMSCNFVPLHGLAMFDSRVCSLAILEVLDRCKVSLRLECPRECLTRGKYIYVKSACMGDCC